MKEIRISGSLHADKVTQVDDADYESLVRSKWYIVGEGYVGRKSAGKALRIHRVILGLVRGDGVHVDHIDGNRLNNQRSNLRKTTQALNNQNRRPNKRATSPYRGVSFRERTGRWIASGCVRRAQQHIGCFDTEIDAARAAQDWRREHLPFSVEVPL